jgi:hypothetical protein
METITVTFQLVGPLKRSTFQRETPDPILEGTNDVLHWSWSTRVQIDRFVKSLRADLNRGKGARLEQRRRSSLASYDEHLFLVATANLDRALDAAPPPIKRVIALPRRSRRALRLLRNIYEHWDELRQCYRKGTEDTNRTARKLRKEFPEADPWSSSIDPAKGEIIIANIIPLGPFIKGLRHLEARMHRLERHHKKGRSTNP